MSKSRVGIITIPDYNNYGNRLQNYAVKTLLERLGCEVDSVEWNDPYFKKYNERRVKLLLRKWKLSFVSFAYALKSGGLYKAQRQMLFEKFTNQHLNPKFYPTFSDAVKKKLNDTYDYFALGSDQIWNPNVNQTPVLFWGKFTPPENESTSRPVSAATVFPQSMKRRFNVALQMRNACPSGKALGR